MADTATRILLVRHAENDAPTTSEPDPGLTERGSAQSELLARRISRTHEAMSTSRLLSSSLRRARETCHSLEKVLGPADVDEDLREMDWGSSTGLSLAEVERLFGTIKGVHAKFGPDGESWSEFVRRGCASLRGLARESAGQTSLVVCHTGIIECSFIEFGRLTKRAQRLHIKPKNASITEWVSQSPESSGWRLERYNDYQHLWVDGALRHGEDLSDLARGGGSFWRAVGMEADA